MENTLNNIKFDIYKYQLGDSGVMYPVLVASGFSGYFEDVTGRNLGKIGGPIMQMNTSAQFKLIVEIDPLYSISGAVYRNNIEAYFRAGFFIRITQRRHPTLGIWVTVEQERQYKIDYIQYEDVNGSRYIASLKDEPVE